MAHGVVLQGLKNDIIMVCRGIITNNYFGHFSLLLFRLAIHNFFDGQSQYGSW